MPITLNGKSTDAHATPLTVAALLGELGLTGQPVLVELNGTALHIREHAGAEITDGAIIEIIRIAAGG